MQSEIEQLKEQTMQAQYQAELAKAESGFELDQDLNDKAEERNELA
jgi:hypothetical protein